MRNRGLGLGGLGAENEALTPETNENERGGMQRRSRAMDAAKMDKTSAQLSGSAVAMDHACWVGDYCVEL